MKFPLAVYSLLFLAALLAFYAQGLAARPRRRRFAPPPPPSPWRQALRRIVTDGARTYIPFAVVAAMMVSLGKPERLPQAVAWAVVALYVLQALAIVAERQGLRRLLAILSALAVAYLWVLQLPLFAPVPL